MSQKPIDVIKITDSPPKKKNKKKNSRLYAEGFPKISQYTHQTPNVKACLTGCLIYQSRWMAACLIAWFK